MRTDGKREAPEAGVALTPTGVGQGGLAGGGRRRSDNIDYRLYRATERARLLELHCSSTAGLELILDFSIPMKFYAT